MNKKVFICLLPGLMALSACAGANQKVADNNYYLEDTLLHEEIFGSLEEPATPIKSIRNLDPVDTVAPRIGVQYADGSVANTISIRYVAAVNIPTESLSSYSAVWTRKVYNKDGTRHTFTDDTGTIDCTKVYPSIIDNGSSLAASAFNPGSTYFVVYTLRNIPNDDLGGALLASITIDDNDPETNPVVSKSIATRLDIEANSVRVALTSDDLAINGYYLKGILGGVAGTVYNDDDPMQGSNHASFCRNLTKDDTFCIVWNDTTNSKFNLFGSSRLRGEGISDKFIDDNGKIKTVETGTYTIYLNTDDLIYANKQTTKDLYIRGEFNSYGMLPEYQFTTSDGNYAQIIDVQLEAGWEFEIASSDWKQKWHFDYYTLNDQDWTSFGGIGGGAAGNFVKGGGDKIKVDTGKTGYYRFFITTGYKIYAELRP